MMLTPRLMHALTLLGISPFFIAVLAIGFDAPGIPMPSGPTLEWLYILRAYGAVILSFLGGIHWGVAMKEYQSPFSFNLVLWSNIVSLSSWLALLIPFNAVAFFFLAICFLVQWVVDRQLNAQLLTPVFYAHLRTQGTIAVVPLLCIAGILTLFS